jgi:uncharacterized repeat protein (TIGR01451 family)
MRQFAELLLAVVVLAAPTVAAAGPLIVESSVLTERKQAAADGTVKVSLAPASRVVPGDKVIFVLSYRNTGTQPIADIVLSNPLPRGIAYRAPAAGSPAPELSVDGKSYGALPSLHVAAANGAQRAATADDVTHVRWRLAAPLPAGAKGQFSFSAVLK